MFRGLKAIMYKEFIHMRRDRMTVIIALVIPIIQLIIFGYAVERDVKNIPTVVFDQDRSAESRELPYRFENTGYFRVIHEVDSSEAVYVALRSGEAKVGIIIPPGFGGDRFSGIPTQAQVLLDGSDSTVAMQALNVANAIGLRISLVSASTRMGIPDPMNSMPLEIRPRVLFNPTMVSANFMVPGIVGILLWILSVLLTALAIVKERERGTIEQLFVSPLAKPAFILGKLFPFAILGIIEAAIVLALAHFVLHVPINGSIGLLALLLIPFVLTALMVGLVISTFATTQGQAMQLSMTTMMPSVILSGFMFPRASMPHIIYIITCFVPLTYFLEIVRGIVIRGAIWADLWDETAILSGFFLFFLLVAIRRFKKQLG
jgi:ABC-type multidrug transport system permease subunit